MNHSRVYQLTPMEGFEFVAPVRDEDFEVFATLDGTPRAATWKPIEMKVVGHQSGRSLRSADLPWLGRHVLVLSARAVEMIGDRLAAGGELLPLSCKGRELYVFHTLHLVDALDEEASTVKRFESGRIMMVKRYIFRPAALEGAESFRLPQFPRACPVYATQGFVDALEATGLQGTTFQELWSDATDDDAGPTARSDRSGPASPLAPDPRNEGPREPMTPTDVFLRGVWQSVIPRTDDVSWVTRVAAHPFKDEPLGDYGPLVQRMLDAGLSPEEIARFAQLVGYETAFGMCDYVEDSEMAYAYEPDDAPQFHWGMFLVDPSTERPVIPLGGLHSGILSADPSDREMRPERRS